ncbi:MAG: tRNA (adenosine(37)-N6)-dimethylallyltransferase MiaA [Atopobiaceae bacterium]|nr:tRNA (adenosine(37)-N6)-dimethylallyltransferase MiaA [Atopobiaceae bacterium]
MSRGHVLCIVGPTAVGKSEVAERVAAMLDGEVVSVDSMQVYRGMDIGTAKVPRDKRTRSLHMVDVAGFDEPYSVAQFQHDARACIDELLLHATLPVLCGGTGLYLDAVIDNMEFPHGVVGGQGRTAYERMAEEEGPEALHALLAERDPSSALEIHPHNVRRVVRALEMLDEGVSYSEHHKGLKRRTPHYDARIWALTLPREALYAVIDKRVEGMFNNGLVDEVESLREQGLETCATACKAIGYKEVLAYFHGEVTLDEARELVKRNTRRYAKRQLSWIRRDGRAQVLDMAHMDSEKAAQLIADDWRSM